MNRELVLDTETTGLPANWDAPLSDSDNWPRCVQIAWQLHDDLGKLIENKSYIVKPENFDIPYESEKIHGISTKLAETDGTDLEKVLKEFSGSIMKSKFIIGHYSSILFTAFSLGKNVLIFEEGLSSIPDYFFKDFLRQFLKISSLFFSTTLISLIFFSTFSLAAIQLFNSVG